MDTDAGRYADSRPVTITPESITFRRSFSLPLFRDDRTVRFAESGRIGVLQPAKLPGRWRLGGSGSLRTWFPFDLHRSSRDRIFVPGPGPLQRSVHARTGRRSSRTTSWRQGQGS